MKTFKSNLLVAFRSLGLPLAVFVCFGFASQARSQNVNSGSPSSAFPHDASYAYGLKPNGSSQSTMDQAVSNMYNNWYANAVESSGAGGTATVNGHSIPRLRV
ncbi:MAG: hypothetical protein ACREL1_04890, partial [bacterium]